MKKPNHLEEIKIIAIIDLEDNRFILKYNSNE